MTSERTLKLDYSSTAWWLGSKHIKPKIILADHTLNDSCLVEIFLIYLNPVLDCPFPDIINRKQNSVIYYTTFKLRMNCGTMFSFTKATTQPPHPAPVSLAPSAPLSRQTSTSSSSSGQLLTKIMEIIKVNIMFIQDLKANGADLC